MVEILRKTTDRYYTSNSTTMCRRCNEYGHMAKMCPNETTTSCHFCLGDHVKEDCRQNSCFKCGELGHRSDTCPNSRRPMCNRCRKRGHIAKDCTFLINFRNQRTHEHLDEKISKIRCVSCMNPGHLQCHMGASDYKKLVKRDQLYLKSNLEIFIMENADVYRLDRDFLKRQKKSVLKKLSELGMEEDDLVEETLRNYKKYDRDESRKKFKQKPKPPNSVLKKRKKSHSSNRYGGPRQFEDSRMGHGDHGGHGGGGRNYGEGDRGNYGGKNRKRYRNNNNGNRSYGGGNRNYHQR